MPVPLLTPYFAWLQKGNPTGNVEVYPEINENFESSVKGIYIAGDLTGIPLLKMAAESGAKVIRHINRDPGMRQGAGRPADGPAVLIIGGGPAGIAAALECEKAGLDYLLVESSHLFQTIENFPKGKLILAKPDELEPQSPLVIRDGTKESLLEELTEQAAKVPLNVRQGVRVQAIRRRGGGFVAETNQGDIPARRVVVAIGKSGNPRKLGIPGESREHVYNRLFDPGEWSGKQILVVGGGDSALEASVALAEAGNHVTHSYRGNAFDRPKEENLRRFRELAAKGGITPMLNSHPVEIRPGEVFLDVKGEARKTVPNDIVYVLIGRELPLGFFRRCGIRLQGEKDLSWYVYLAAMLSFFTMLYFGKAGFAADLFAGKGGFWQKLASYFAAPFALETRWVLEGHAWYGSLNFYLGWLGSVVFIPSGLAALWFMLRRRDKYFGSAWPRIKYGYLILVGICFTWVYFSSVLGRNAGWVAEPTYYYSLFYCSTMALFAIRRVQVRKTRYVRLQMLTVVFIQVFFLFLLPFHLFDAFIRPHVSADGFLMREMFPKGKWSSFGFILFWPLNINDFGASTFWTWFPFVQTFGILFLLVYLFGKGAYCAWICSCGGMAETLGDEYRHLSPHGPRAKSLENIGQIILVFAFIATGLAFFAHRSGQPSLWADSLWGAYKTGVDIVFAGVLGLGVYFFWGGRIWCRYGCPLAALMHVYARFSVYRIFAEKKKCISCNICTKVCHMGIDVMGYANKGIPMNDVECVRCSACVTSCPTEVLAFGSLAKPDPANRSRRELPGYVKEDWRAGIR